jgi:hypothetical protein
VLEVPLEHELKACGKKQLKADSVEKLDVVGKVALGYRW